MAVDVVLLFRPEFADRRYRATKKMSEDVSLVSHRFMNLTNIMTRTFAPNLIPPPKPGNQRLPVPGRRLHPGQLPGHQRDGVAPFLHISGARLKAEGRLPRRGGA